MSFLFKNKQQKGPSPNALPQAARDIRSSEGPPTQIPPFNGSLNGSKPTSPTTANYNMNAMNPGERATSSAGAGPRNPHVAQYSEDNGPRSMMSPGPEQKTIRERGNDMNEYGVVPRNMPLQSRPAPSASDSSPYPWSQRRINFTVPTMNPFPRYGAAVNASSGKDGSIYIMGGLINGSTVKGDLWMLEASNGNPSCFPVATTSEGPGPRVGHASLLVGNAFIVFGGDTKMDEGDLLDDTLYLLNTSTKQWSRALPAGPRVPGRYGHTLNILGSKIYIFGGQVDGYFFNDLVAFDLNALQQTTNHWEILIQNTIDGGPPHGQIPPARTNHTMISWGDKLYLFGGTDGVHWFNDVWAYAPQTNSWTQLDCIGFFPSPREGHAAALVGDVMYIFGGRNEEGNDLGDLAAFRITLRRWYTFQNMGQSPSPRSGHSMTTVGKSIVVLAGEPSSAPRDPVELSQAYFLDTTKIRYPPDNTPPQNGGDKTIPAGRPSQESGLPMQTRNANKEFEGQRTDSRLRADSTSSRLPRVAGAPGQPLSPAPIGPPPQAPGQNRMNGMAASRQPTRPAERGPNQPPETDRVQRYDGPGVPSPPGARDKSRSVTSPSIDEPQAYKPETYRPSQDASVDGVRRSLSQQNRQDSRLEEHNGSISPYVDAPEQPSKVRQLQSEEYKGPQDSGVGSSPALTQAHDDVLRELDQLKQKNAWYASELALARKSGYQTRDIDSPALDDRAAESLGDDDKPLIEALLKMRSELTRVQDAIDEQSKRAAARIAEVEKQRDTAVSEAVFAKAKLAGQGSPGLGEDTKRAGNETPDRSNDMSRRLASSIAAQSEFSRRIGALVQEIEYEKAARQVAEDTTEATQKRVAELEQHRQQSSSELERLRATLIEAQIEARELSANHAEISSQHRLLTLDKSELSEKLENANASSEDHSLVLASLRTAVQASTDKAEAYSEKLKAERNTRDALEQELRSLKIEHENSQASLQATNKRLQDAEELAQKHADEARTHREAVLAGLDKFHDQHSPLRSVSDERVVVLQQQADTATALARQNQAAADAAAEKLRSAEERIAGLEAYQEQASRESLSIRKQLQAAIKETQALHAEKLELEQKFQSQILETNALKVQHASLKDILGERGINPSEVRRSRALDSPSSISNRFSTPDLQRVRDLEQQLEASFRGHEEMKAQFEAVSERDEKMKREYEEKLTALDNDHQAAVKYLRGTEKMLSKMKQELQRVKNENGELKKRVEKARIDSREGSPMIGASSDWAQEREKLQKEFEGTQASLKASMSDMETRIQEMESQLQTSTQELEQTRSDHAATKSSLSALQASHGQHSLDMERLHKENSDLEVRARDAENKVQLLLDQVEHSVDNYRRQSRMATDGQATTMNGVHHSRSLSAQSAMSTTLAAPAGHSRNMSDSANSIYSTTSPDDVHDGRNSLALDSLASELDALRSHWETTNKTYRLSDKFEFDRTPTMDHSGGPAFSGGISKWHHELDMSDDGSRPGTSEGTVRGDSSPRDSNGDGASASGVNRAGHANNTTTKTTSTTTGPGGATMI